MKIEIQAESAILAELGARFSQARLDRNWPQEGLAQAAAVSKRTVERLEAGQSVQLSSLIGILKALGLLRNLDQLVPATGPRPIEQLKHRGRIRRRASLTKEDDAGGWSWGDKS